MANLPSIDKVETGENIRRYMRKTHIDTLDLQYSLGMTSPSTIYAWRQGRILPSAENLVKLASIFGCKIDDILVISEG